MKWLEISLMSVLLTFVGGCATCQHDTLRAAYEAGELSPAEYQAMCIERDEARSRELPAHSDFLQTRVDNRSKLPPW